MSTTERDDDDQDEGTPDRSEAGRPDSRLYKKVKYFNLLVDAAAKGLTDAEFKVWCVLFRFAENGLARVSKRKVAERAGMSERHVARKLVALAKKQMLRVVKRGGRGRGSNEYLLGINTELPLVSRRGGEKKANDSQATSEPDMSPSNPAPNRPGRPRPAAGVGAVE